MPDGAAVLHDEQFLREAHLLVLVVRHIDHRGPELLGDLSDLAPQRVLHLRADHGERLVHQDGRHVVTDHAAAE
ncbi:hypothetical protein [Streptomyces chartreusis]|uniref:hypothetical protein n=1 Tax=Streptomyces chartreusis TaxID=1969 RepID=UPI00363CDD52